MVERSNVNCSLDTFDRDIPIQAGIVGAIHFTHPAFTDRRDDFIGAEFISGRKRHMQDSVKFSR